MNDKQNTDISIIIPTHNNCVGLSGTIDSILLQEGIEDICFDLFIVDNNSKDNTKQIVEQYIKDKGDLIHYIFELQKGISYARNAALRLATGNIIAFTDDDCIADKNWMRNLVDTYQKYQPDAVQGKIEWGVDVPDDTDYPRWFLEQRIAKVDYFDHIAEFTDKDLVGANMSIRREIYEKCGGFSTNMLYRVNEDTEFSRRITKLGVKKVYNPNAVIYHHFNLARINNKKLIYQSYYFGRSSIVLEESHISWQRHLRFCVKQLVINFCALWMQYNKKSFFLTECKVAALWGRCVQLVRTNVFKIN